MKKVYKQPTFVAVSIAIESGYSASVTAGIEDADILDQGEY
jgi:hypothetical protein